MKNGPNIKPVVRHTCDVPLCCNPNHLLSGTVKENNDDKMVKGRWANGMVKGTVCVKENADYYVRSGENHVWAKLTKDDVIYIRQSSFSFYKLAKQFNVTKQCIHNIIKRKTWKNS